MVLLFLVSNWNSLICIILLTVFLWALSFVTVYYIKEVNISCFLENPFISLGFLYVTFFMLGSVGSVIFHCLSTF
jgi:hypothetical protein